MIFSVFSYALVMLCGASTADDSALRSLIEPPRELDLPSSRHTAAPGYGPAMSIRDDAPASIRGASEVFSLREESQYDILSDSELSEMLARNPYAANPVGLLYDVYLKERPKQSSLIPAADKFIRRYRDAINCVAVVISNDDVTITKRDGTTIVLPYHQFIETLDVLFSAIWYREFALECSDVLGLLSQSEEVVEDPFTSAIGEANGLLSTLVSMSASQLAAGAMERIEECIASMAMLPGQAGPLSRIVHFVLGFYLSGPTSQLIGRSLLSGSGAINRGILKEGSGILFTFGCKMATFVYRAVKARRLLPDRYITATDVASEMLFTAPSHFVGQGAPVSRAAALSAVPASVQWIANPPVRREAPVLLDAQGAVLRDGLGAADIALMADVMREDV